MNMVQEIEMEALQQLASDLKKHRTFRFTTSVLLLLNLGFLIWFMMLRDGGHALPQNLKTAWIFFGMILAVSLFLLLENLSNLKRSTEGLHDLLIEHRRLITLCGLLNPMMYEAFTHKPEEIKGAMVDELINQLRQTEQTRTNIHNCFLKDSLEEVKDLVRARCREIHQQAFADIQEMSGDVHSQDIVRLTEVMADAEAILGLIPDHRQTPMPEGAHIVTEVPPYHVTDPHS